MVKSQGLDIELLNYDLPKELIANEPANPRDSSRLMVVGRINSTITYNNTFKDIIDFLDENTVLVMNNTKVFPARVITTKKTGGKVELLFLRKTAKNTWECIHKGHVQFGQTLYLKDLELSVVSKKDKLIEINVSHRENDLFSYMKKYGLTPLPPYIKPTQTEKNIQKEYQTIYAKITGAAAAPTAGLHFTKKLLDKIKEKNIPLEFVTLHVGLGTFAPVEEADLTKHKIHEEYISVDEETAKRLSNYKKQGKKIIAVGTTTLRTLESVADDKGNISPYTGETNIFIYPPYKFKFVDHLITNYHLPESTLLALVSAFVSYPNTTQRFKSFKDSLLGRSYEKAIEEKFRFFSFGDAMLIL